MLCPQCSHAALDSEQFCTACGGRLSAAGAPELSRSWAGYGLPAVSWRGGEVATGLLLVGMAFLFISMTTLMLGSLDWLDYGLAWGSFLGSHAIGLAILAVVWLLGREQGRFSWAALGLGRPRLPWFYSFSLAVAALGTSIGATALYAWLLLPLDVDWLLPPDIGGEIMFPGIYSLLTFEALALWTPFTEEIFFRGFVFAGLAPRLGVWRSGIASALLFALFHLHPGVLLPILLTGLLLAALYRYTGSLWPAVLAHAGQNGLALGAIMFGL